MTITQETRRRAVVAATNHLEQMVATVHSLEDQLRGAMAQAEVVRQTLAEAVANRAAAEATLEAVSALLAEGMD